jgi:glutamate/tyrosine decarboxylase-like PLP-dependent enzyme
LATPNHYFYTIEDEAQAVAVGMLWFMVHDRAAQERGFALAELAESAVRDRPGWEVVTPAQMGVVTFCYWPEGAEPEETDTLNRELVDAMIAAGFAMVTSTVLRGRTVLRMCTINPRTTEADILGTIERLDSLARRAG